PARRGGGRRRPPRASAPDAGPAAGRRRAGARRALLPPPRTAPRRRLRRVPWARPGRGVVGIPHAWTTRGARSGRPAHLSREDVMHDVIMPKAVARIALSLMAAGAVLASGTPANAQPLFPGE